jgi:hypothetical protein
LLIGKEKPSASTQHAAQAAKWMRLARLAKQGLPLRLLLQHLRQAWRLVSE